MVATYLSWARVGARHSSGNGVAMVPARFGVSPGKVGIKGLVLEMNPIQRRGNLSLRMEGTILVVCSLLVSDGEAALLWPPAGLVQLLVKRCAL